MTYNKYGNRKVEFDGYKFDSVAEYDRYCELKILQRAGHISDLKIHPAYVLQATFKNGVDKTVRSLSYVADFEYIELETKEKIVEDVKGVWTKEFRIKKKLFERRYHPLTITIIQVEKPCRRRSKRRR